MAEIATVRKLRVANFKLMTGNLALLMAIRETDSQIQDEWGQLQQLCQELEKKGATIPTSCHVLMGDPSEAPAEESHDEESANDGAAVNFFEGIKEASPSQPVQTVASEDGND